MAWECKIPEEEGGGFDHDWKWEHNGGDSWRVCRACGAEDIETPYEGEDQEFYDRQFD